MKKIEEIIKQIENDNQKSNFIYLSAKLESEIVILNPDEQKEYLKQYYLEDSGLNKLIKKLIKLWV